MKFKRFLSVVLILALTVAFLNLPVLAAVPLSVYMGTPAYSGSRLYFPDLTVTGINIKTILISFSGEVTSGDKIVLPASPAGYTVSASSLTNDYAKRINLTGEISSADVQNYLRAVGYELGGEVQSVQIVVTSDDIQRDTFYNIDTEHYYQFVPYSSGTTGTWTSAYNSAKALTYMGRTGYLATVMNKAEDQYLYELSDGATGWLGGTFMSPGTKSGNYYSSFSTSSNVNYWYWACGPEIGTKFYTVQVKSTTSINDSINAGYYFNWGSVEPNSANVEQCLTTLVVSTANGYDHNETGYQGTAFSWNNLAYDRGYSSDGLYYAKGYFVEYGDSLIGDSGADSSAFAISIGTLSDKPVLTAGTVTRVSDMHAIVKFTSDEAGTFYFAITDDNAGVPAIDTSGAGVVCTAGENTITNPTDLTAGAKDIYILVKDTEGIFSDPLKIDIPAFVAGEVVLSTVSWKSASTYTCGIELPPVARMVTISVNNGSFKVPSLGSGTLVFLGGTNGSSYINSYSSSQSYSSAVFSFTDVAAAETLLGGIVYSTVAETPQTITASASSVSPQSSDIYFEGHFYRYIAGSIDWIGAVLAAGGTTDPYFGGRGYIATATNQAENSILLKLTDMGGTAGDHWYDAWMGGLWQRNTGTVASPSITRGTDGNEISYSDLLNATAAQRQNMLLDYTIKYGTNVSFINTTPNTVKYYWLDGPEAGQEIALNTTAFSPWHEGEPNNGDFNYI